VARTAAQALYPRRPPQGPVVVMTSNPANNGDDPQDPLSEMFAKFFGGGEAGMDPEEMAKAAGLPSDPNMLAQMFQQVQAMMSAGGDGPVNWKLAHESARQVAASDSDPSIGTNQAREVDEALRLAELWLDPVTDFEGTGLIGQAWSRAEWVEATLDTWKRLTEPVANSIAFALTSAMTEQVPEEMKEMLGGARSMLQNMGGALFGMQLGQAVGALAKDVVSSTDIGLPLAEGKMALLPTNVKAFGEGLDIPESEIRLFLAVREAAHARLFMHVPWLAGHLLGAIESYARGIHIDMSRIEEVAREIDPTNPESMQNAFSQGVFMPQRTAEQEAALLKLETTLALVEGWVDELSAAATANLPSAGALREMVRRRRATGGPSEHAFAALVGLELRPRRLRDAAALWAALKEERGLAGRDAIWHHPDLLPTAEDLDDPAGFSSRRQLLDASDAEVDEALQKLLSGGFDEPQTEKEPGNDAGTDTPDGESDAPGKDPKAPDA
jgi:putative hydrolase